MSPVDPGRLRRLVEHLRSARVRLADPDADPIRWEIDLYAYDDALVTVADLLDVAVAGSVRDEMGPADRLALEEALADAGVDVFGPEGRAELDPPLDPPLDPRLDSRLDSQGLPRDTGNPGQAGEASSGS